MNFVKKYGHGLVLLGYGVVYMILFILLEHRQPENLHVIHSAVDDIIPFCELFILPYLLWFPFVLFGILYFVFVSDDRKEYYQLAYTMIFGMTVFLAVSFFYPNVQDLRPQILPRDNFCSDLVKFVYAVDTPTNVLPSMHVYISLVVCAAFAQCDDLQEAKHGKVICLVIGLITGVIIASTMIVKQHSFADVLSAFVLAVVGFWLFYYIDIFEPRTMMVKE